MTLATAAGVGGEVGCLSGEQVARLRRFGVGNEAGKLVEACSAAAAQVQALVGIL